jgi:O-6-methylguanine DNA methyltransferase
MSSIAISQIQTPIVVSSGATVWLELLWHKQLISSINFTLYDNPLAQVVPHEGWLEPFERYWHSPADPLTQAALAALPVVLDGTPYQRRIWSFLQQIPAGTTQSYGRISTQFQSSPRAVAAACRANPVVLAVPCHRVVSSSGIGGFMGAMVGDSIDIKKWLLHHEQ